MLARRKFLKLMGVGTAAAPLAAKAALEEETSKLLMRNFPLASSNVVGAGDSNVPPSWGDNEQLVQQAENISNYIRVFGLPKPVEERIRAHASHVWCLDSDIATKRSWSLNVKIQTQRERNFNRRLEQLKTAGPFERAKKALSEKLGFSWNV